MEKLLGMTLTNTMVAASLVLMVSNLAEKLAVSAGAS